MRRQAFTLIELLVVVSIIGLLVAILLPSLKKARVTAQKTVSLTSARQITAASLMYANDNRSTLPCQQLDVTGADIYWGGLLIRDRYLASPRIYWSPARSTWYLAELAAMTTNPRSPRYFHTGYAVNGNATTKESVITAQHRIIQLGVGNHPNESKMMWLMEAWNTGYYPGGLGRDGYNAMTPRNSLSATRIFTYNSAAVHTFLDGHGKATDSHDIGWAATNGDDHYNGTWSYTSAVDYTNVAPWYDNWYVNP